MNMESFLSGDHGYLPYGLVVTSAMALIHTVVTYTRPLSSLKGFSGSSAPAPNTLTAHIYGVKNVYTALIRLYAAQNIHNRELYTLAIFTYVGPLFLYGSEWLIWGNARRRETVPTFFLPTAMLLWMLMQKGWYLDN